MAKRANKSSLVTAHRRKIREDDNHKQPTSDPAAGVRNLYASNRRLRTVKLDKVARRNLYRKMASYLSTGMEIRHAVNVLYTTAVDVDNARSKDVVVLHSWLNMLLEGASVRDLVQGCGGTPGEVALMTAAEEANKIGQGFRDAGELLEQGKERRAILRTLIVPAIQAIGGPLLFFGGGYALAPAFEQAFPVEYWTGAPQVLHAMRPYVLPGMVVFAGVIVGVVFAHAWMVVYLKGALREWVDQWHLVFVLYRMTLAGSLMAAMARLVSSGVRDTRALDILINTVPNNSYVAFKLGQILGLMVNGLSFGLAAFRAGGQWPDRRFVSDLIAFSASAHGLEEGGGLTDVVRVWEEDALVRLKVMVRNVKMAATMIFYGSLIGLILIFGDLQVQSLDHARSIAF